MITKCNKSLLDSIHVRQFGALLHSQSMCVFQKKNSSSNQNHSILKLFPTKYLMSTHSQKFLRKSETPTYNSYSQLKKPKKLSAQKVKQFEEIFPNLKKDDSVYIVSTFISLVHYEENCLVNEGEQNSQPQILKYLDLCHKKLSQNFKNHECSENFLLFYLQSVKSNILNHIIDETALGKAMQSVHSFLKGSKEASYTTETNLHKTLTKALTKLKERIQQYSQNPEQRVQKEIFFLSRSVFLLQFLNPEEIHIYMEWIGRAGVLNLLTSNQITQVLRILLSAQVKISNKLIYKIQNAESYQRLSQFGQTRIKTQFIKQTAGRVSCLQESQFDDVPMPIKTGEKLKSLAYWAQILETRKTEIQTLQSEFSRGFSIRSYNTALQNVLRSTKFSIQNATLDRTLDFFLNFHKKAPVSEFLYKRLFQYLQQYENFSKESNTDLNQTQMNKLEQVLKITEIQKNPIHKYDLKQTHNKELTFKTLRLQTILLKLLLPYRPLNIFEVSELLFIQGESQNHSQQSVTNLQDQQKSETPGKRTPNQLEVNISKELISNSLNKIVESISQSNETQSIDFINKVCRFLAFHAGTYSIPKNLLKSWLKSIRDLSSQSIGQSSLQKVSFQFNTMEQILRVLKIETHNNKIQICQELKQEVQTILKDILKVIKLYPAKQHKSRPFINTGNSLNLHLVTLMESVIELSHHDGELSASVNSLLKEHKSLILEFINGKLIYSVRSAFKGQILKTLNFLKYFNKIQSASTQVASATNPVRIQVYSGLFLSLSTYMSFISSKNKYYFKADHQLAELITHFVENKQLFASHSQKNDFSYVQTILIIMIKRGSFPLTLGHRDKQKNTRILLDIMEIFGIDSIGQSLVDIIKKVAFLDEELEGYKTDFLVEFSEINDDMWSYLEKNQTPGIKSKSFKPIHQLSHEELSQQLNRKHIYQMMLRNKHFIFPSDFILPPTLSDKEDQMCFAIQKIFEQIITKNEFRIENSASFKHQQFDLKPFLSTLDLHKLVEKSVHTEFKLVPTKLKKLSRCEIWKENHLLEKKIFEAQRIELGSKMDIKIYQNLIDSLFGNHEKIKTIAEEFPSYSQLSYVAVKQGAEFKEHGCIIEILAPNSESSLLVICTTQSNYKILTVCAYLLNTLGQKTFLASENTKKQCFESVIKDYLSQNNQKNDAVIDDEAIIEDDEENDDD